MAPTDLLSPRQNVVSEVERHCSAKLCNVFVSLFTFISRIQLPDLTQPRSQPTNGIQDVHVVLSGWGSPA